MPALSKNPLILGIETSCDDCSVSLVQGYQKVHVLLLDSQHRVHRDYRGIVPELASRNHSKAIFHMFKDLQKKALDCGIDLGRDLDAIAVTNRPGLSGSLLVGTQFAKGLALGYNIPVIPVDHILAHFFSYRIEHDEAYPAIACVVSGGHTLFGIAHDPLRIEIVGRTLDDACGEAFDKLATFYNMGYPGGPVIDRLAQNGSPKAARFSKMPIPKNSYDISFSGLKTAATVHRSRHWNSEFEFSHEHLCASFSHVAIGMIIDRIRLLLQKEHKKGIKTIVFGGGVAVNTNLRKEMEILAREYSVSVLFPSLQYCVDNAAMIACLGCYMYQSQSQKNWNLDFGVQARVPAYRSQKGRK